MKTQLEQIKDEIERLGRNWDGTTELQPASLFQADLYELLAFIESLEKKAEKEETPTCRFCGFYENNCPFIRDKFTVYPNRVCKDYTPSALKYIEEKK